MLRLLTSCTLVVGLALAGCSSPQPLVPGPFAVKPVTQPSYVERAPTGSIFRASTNNTSLFSDQRKPQAIGDSLKIDIAENLSASNTVANTNSRANSVSSKGPGTGPESGGFFHSIANMNATASGSDNFTGKGDNENAAKFTGRIAATVTNVLGNGNLVVAGERTMAFNGSMNTLRFSGIVNPLDIKAGGIVASSDIVDAKLELVGKGDVPESSGKTWLQRVLTSGLSVW